MVQSYVNRNNWSDRSETQQQYTAGVNQPAGGVGQYAGVYQEFAWMGSSLGFALELMSVKWKSDSKSL